VGDVPRTHQNSASARRAASYLNRLGHGCAGAIVVGYGPVGRTLCRILLHVGVRVTVVDLQPTTIEKLKKLGRDAIFGDATRREVLLAAGIEGSRCLIVTLPDQSTRAAILTTARALAPRITILTRARYLDEQLALERAGADSISYEEAEVAMELARLMLGTLGVAQETLDEEVRVIRAEIAVRTGFTTIRPRLPPAPAVPSDDVKDDSPNDSSIRRPPNSTGDRS